MVEVSSSVTRRVTESVSVQARLRPEAVALAFGNTKITYCELERRANQLAHLLMDLDIAADSPIGLLMHRSPEAAIAALGVLKAGAPYLPLDPRLPSERLTFMAREAGVPVVITDDRTAGQISSGPWKLISIDGHRAELAARSERPHAISLDGRDLAYVIYTSGSTGEPKGVLIEHASLSNLIAWHNDTFGLTDADRVSHISSFGFDAAVWELWPALAAGASVHFVDDRIRTKPEALRDWLCANRISVSFVPTAIAEHIIRLKWPADTSLRWLLTGADTLHQFPACDLPFTLVNNYGPTEATVVATSGIVARTDAGQKSPSIGRPIFNTSVHILDRRMQPVMPGDTGELYIGGAGLARGYLNRPEMSWKKFVRDPFSSERRARLYRTGDLVRQLPSGEIAFVGRADNQIKIRGFRIEPEEIAVGLTRHPAVISALVTARTDPYGDKRLTAYVVGNRGLRPEASALKESLRTQLPDYMIPSDVVWLDSFPLTSNGKVDQAALPPPATAPQTAATDCNSSTQERLTAIVAGLLGVDTVCPEDNFFLLGGHSLLGAQMIARIRDLFGVELSLRNLFESTTLAALASAVESRREVMVHAAGTGR